jgi:hypothetical protein
MLPATGAPNANVMTTPAVQSVHRLIEPTSKESPQPHTSPLAGHPKPTARACDHRSCMQLRCMFLARQNESVNKRSCPHDPGPMNAQPATFVNVYLSAIQTDGERACSFLLIHQ